MADNNKPAPTTHDNTTASPWELVAEGGWLTGQRFPIGEHCILGRDASCDITIPGTHLSRRHVELAIKGDLLLIRDLDSANGCFVNDQRISETQLKPGDTIRFDVLNFRVSGPIASANTRRDNATLIHTIEPASSPEPVPQNKAGPSAVKNWQSKPTSVGNRHQTTSQSISRKAANYLWVLLATLTGLGTLAAIAFLLSQL